MPEVKAEDVERIKKWVGKARNLVALVDVTVMDAMEKANDFLDGMDKELDKHVTTAEPSSAQPQKTGGMGKDGTSLSYKYDYVVAYTKSKKLKEEWSAEGAKARVIALYPDTVELAYLLLKNDEEWNSNTTL